MLDVAAVAEQILLREPTQTRIWIASQLGLPLDQVPKLLAAIVGLHDFGKIIACFQHQWPPGMDADRIAGLGFRPASLRTNRHEFASAALLRAQFLKLGIPAGWAHAIACALGAHHGYMPTAQECKDAKHRNEGQEWDSVREEIFGAYWATFEITGVPSQDEVPLPVVAWIAGLTSVSDWIGSNLDWFPLGERADGLADCYKRAGDLANSALDEISWPRFRPLLDVEANVDTDALIRRIFGSPNVLMKARPLQQAADELLRQITGPTLLLVEAPMGEGKTELAFLAHLRLQAANNHRGLYVALPTQATSNAMFDRTLTFVNGFSSGERQDIQLVHGGSLLNERIHHLRNVDSSAGESISSSAWFSQRKRPLLSGYGVGTIDQALFGALNVKHHFVRLWGLANRVVVFDEVHAYDSYTSGLIEAALRWFKAMGCSVVLMTATLPAKRRASFLRAWGADDRPDISYPRVLMTTDRGTIGSHIDCRTLAPITVSGISEDLNSLADAAVSAVSEGGCGVVIVNTVKRAQGLYSLMKARLPADVELLLFHARFPGDVRSEIEGVVLDKFGKSTKNCRPTKSILIATQVAEQSLDLDFDFMISDLAPIDLLLQRAGRLHRHERSRPSAHVQPHLIVAGLMPDRLPDLVQTAWGFVYDPHILYRTTSVLREEPVWNLPADIDRLVQRVYASTPTEDDERSEYMRTLNDALGKHYADEQRLVALAINAQVDVASEFQNAYLNKPRGGDDDADGNRAVTRLGTDSISVVPILVADDGWRLFADEAAFNPNIVPNDALARRIYRRQIRLSRKDILHAMLAQPEFEAFRGHPLLKNLKPILMTGGVAQFGRIFVGLSPELGLTCETLTSTSKSI